MNLQVVDTLEHSKTAAPAPPTELERIRARRGLRGVLPLLGPAFVACIAYVDPGNF